jgi:hypothetical protein
MNRKIFLYLMVIAVCAGLAGVFYLLAGPSGQEKPDPGFETGQTPSRLVQFGPYAKNVMITEKIGAYDLTMSAKRLNMKKTRFMGFSCGLYKKVAMHGAELALYRNGEKVLEVAKDDVIMSPGMKVIDMVNPRVLFPATLRNVTRVKIDKERKIVRIYRNGAVDTLNLSL